MDRTPRRTGQDLTDEIKKVAYQLYEKRGRKPGHEKADWFEAERIVKRQFSSNSSRTR